MKKRNEVLAAALLSASVVLGAESLSAQSSPGSGSSMPGNQDRSGPTVPPGPDVSPTIPGQPAPGVPPTGPIPGQRGTIPEKMGPDASDKGMVVTSEHIKKAQDALKAKGLTPGTGGKLDPQTQQALRDFQKANNLPATGVLDEKTAAKLGVTMSTSEKSPSAESTSPSSKPSGSVR
jgi:Putative peptidoglycan binding domain